MHLILNHNFLMINWCNYFCFQIKWQIYIISYNLMNISNEKLILGRRPFVIVLIDRWKIKSFDNLMCQILIVNKRWFIRDFFQDFQFVNYHINKWNIINGKERIVMNLDLSKIWKPFWISPAQKSFLLTEPGKEDVFIIFICFQTLSVKRPKIFSARIYS